MFLDDGEGYFYDPTKDESSFKTFLDWLKCYYKPGMQNLVDHNGRTIWFSGKAGPLAPKGKLLIYYLTNCQNYMVIKKNTVSYQVERKVVILDGWLCHIK